MFTYEANITCSVRDCVSIATGDTCDSPDTARHSAKMEALQNGWLVLSNGSAYCPHHHAESRLCPERKPPSPKQIDLITKLVRSLSESVAEKEVKTAGEALAYVIDYLAEVTSTD